jgi:hypothetical protein
VRGKHRCRSSLVSEPTFGTYSEGAGSSRTSTRKFVPTSHCSPTRKSRRGWHPQRRPARPALNWAVLNRSRSKHALRAPASGSKPSCKTFVSAYGCSARILASPPSPRSPSPLASGLTHTSSALWMRSCCIRLRSRISTTSSPSGREHRAVHTPAARSRRRISLTGGRRTQFSTISRP